MVGSRMRNSEQDGKRPISSYHWSLTGRVHPISADPTKRRIRFLFWTAKIDDPTHQKQRSAITDRTEEDEEN